MQHGFVDFGVRPVVSEVVQVVVKVYEVFVGSALQQGRGDLLSFCPVLEWVSATGKRTHRFMKPKAEYFPGTCFWLGFFSSSF